jgi:hypothetical protein
VDEKVGRGWGWAKKIGFGIMEKVESRGVTRTFYIRNVIFVT